MSFSDVSPGALEIALKIARGSYQRGIIRGTEGLGGAVLRGRAKEYRGRYLESEARLLQRLRADPRLRVWETPVPGYAWATILFIRLKEEPNPVGD